MRLPAEAVQQTCHRQPIRCCTLVQHTMCHAEYVHWGGVNRWSVLALVVIAVVIEEVVPCNQWPLTSTQAKLVGQASGQTVASTDETFLPCSSPYCSSHWIGRSMKVVKPDRAHKHQCNKVELFSITV